MKRLSLVRLKPETSGRIVEIAGGGELQRRLRSMGASEGTRVTKMSHVGLRGPIVIKVGRSILALGHGMAERVFVEAE